jgi:hypothetical protein
VTNREIAWGIVGLTTAHDDAKWERLQDAITTALDAKDAAARPPAGHIMESDGTVRKVLGTLPVTADGAVAAAPARVYEPYTCAELIINKHITTPGFPVIVVMDGVHRVQRYDPIPIGCCYSTREAAEAAQRAAGGGA